MGSAVVSAGTDAWVSQNFPTRNYGADKYLAIRSTAAGPGPSGGGVGLMYFRSPVPAGATVTSAVIEIRTYGASPNATQTLALRRITESWTESRVTFNTYPAYVSGPSGTLSVAPNTPSGTWLSFDVTNAFQAFANGTKNYGFRIDTSTTAGVTRLRGFQADYKPVLRVSWSDAPAAPTNLRPNGIVSRTHPTLMFDHVDNAGDKTIDSVQMQLSNSESFASPVFDSGEVDSDAPELVLQSTAFAGLSEGQTLYWRARVKDGSGLWSAWSDDASMQRISKPNLQILSPDPAYGFTEATPPVVWSSPNQKAYRVVVDRIDSTKRLYDSGRLSGSTNDVTLPTLPDDSVVKVIVQTWDNVAGRVASPGDPTNAQASVTVGVNVDPTVDSPINVTVEQQGITPNVRIRWFRGAMPDSFTIYRNGRVIASNLDPSDSELTTDGENYVYTYDGAKPNIPATYTVRAVVNGKSSPDSNAFVFASRCEGIWLQREGTLTDVPIMGTDEGSWSMPEDATIYAPLGSKKVTRVLQGQRGWEGTLTGYIMDGFGGKSYATALNALYDVKQDPMTPVRLIAGDANFSALIGDITVWPVPDQNEGQMHRKVSFSFWQVDDFEW